MISKLGVGISSALVVSWSPSSSANSYGALCEHYRTSYQLRTMECVYGRSLPSQCLRSAKYWSIEEVHTVIIQLSKVGNYKPSSPIPGLGEAHDAVPSLDQVTQ